MAFTLKPDTDRGKVRLLIGDTDTSTSDNQIFEDSEIDAFLSLESSDVYQAAAAACRAIAGNTSRSAVAYRALQGAESIDKRDVPGHYRDLSDQYEERAKRRAPTEEVDSMDYRLGDFGGQMGEFVGDP